MASFRDKVGSLSLCFFGHVKSVCPCMIIPFRNLPGMIRPMCANTFVYQRASCTDDFLSFLGKTHAVFF